MIRNLLKKLFHQPKKLPAQDPLETSNWGRNYGWFIEFEGEKVGELIHPIWEDQFWFRYEIVTYEGKADLLHNMESWIACKFKYLNKHYLQYAPDGFSNGIIIEEGERKTISFRALHLEKITPSN